MTSEPCTDSVLPRIRPPEPSGRPTARGRSTFTENDLGPRARQALADGYVTGWSKIQCRSSIALAYANLAAAGRASFADYHAALHDRGNRALDLLYPARNRDKLITGDWQRAEAKAAADPARHDPAEFRQAIAEVRAALQPQVWTGRTNRTARLVLDAVHDLATEHGRIELSASVRTLAERTGISAPSTISNALKLLTGWGWLVVTKPGKGSNAARYRLEIGRSAGDSDDADRCTCTESEGCAQTEQKGVALIPGRGLVRSVHTCPLPLPLSGEEPFGAARVGSGAGQAPTGHLADETGPATPALPATAAADLLRESDLGRAAAGLYDALTNVPTMPKDLVARSGLARRTVHKHLDTLITRGLARRVDDGYVRVEADLAALAVLDRVRPHGAEQQARHQRERDAYALRRELASQRGRVFHAVDRGRTAEGIAALTDLPVVDVDQHLTALLVIRSISGDARAGYRRVRGARPFLPTRTSNRRTA